MEPKGSTPTSMPVFSLINDQQKKRWLTDSAKKYMQLKAKDFIFLVMMNCVQTWNLIMLTMSRLKL